MSEALFWYAYLTIVSTILIIGNSKKQIHEIRNITERELKSDTFELFRRDSRNVEIITYDELYERAKFIVRK